MSKQPKLDLDGNPIRPQICALCGRRRGDHKAGTLHCPLSRHRFTHFSQTQTYKEREPS
jgi:hypothetical protein